MKTKAQLLNTVLQAILLLATLSPADAQVNSTNIAGTGILLPTAADAATISVLSSTNGGTNSAIIGAANSIVPGATRFAFIGAGNFNNLAAGSHSAAMLAGFSNTLSPGSVRSASVGGAFNTNAGRSSAMIAGENNRIGVNSTGAVVAGGLANIISSSAPYSMIAGGSSNQADGVNAFVAGGLLNQASGLHSFAAGTRAWASNNYSFVWGGSAAVDTVSTNTNSFTARAPGGFTFLTTTNNTTGAVLVAGATSWASLSDSNAKTAVKPLDCRAVLSGFARLPLTEWHYKHDPQRRYIGPMAQDFREIFGLGFDDKHISTLDADGVTFAAIKGLIEEIKEQDAVLAEREAQIRSLRRGLEEMRALHQSKSL